MRVPAQNVGLPIRTGLILIGMSAGLPLFHLYGDPPDDQAFDFMHVETIASRSSLQ